MKKKIKIKKILDFLKEENIEYDFEGNDEDIIEGFSSLKNYRKGTITWVKNYNHDLEMLYKSRRPQCLKDRIHSDHGHLSNVDSAIYFSEVIGPRTKAVYLGHISEECNTADIAVSSYRRLLESRNIDPDSIQIVPTKQWDMVLGGDWE